MTVPRCKLFLPVLLFIFFFSLYFSNQRRLADTTVMSVNSIFYADTSETVEIMTYPTFNMDATKHLLFSVTTYPLVAALSACLGMARDNAALAVVSLAGAFNAAFSFYVIGLFTKEKAAALVFAVLFGILFSNLVLSSIPETYVFSNMMVLFYAFFAKKYSERPGYLRGFSLAAVTALAPLYNPPLLLLLIATGYIMFSGPDISLALRLFQVNALVVLCVFIGANLLAHPNYLDICARIIQKNASVANFFNTGDILNVILSFVLYAVVSPLRSPRPTFWINDALNYLSFPAKLPLTLAYLCFLGFSLKNLLNRGNPVVKGLALWAVSMGIFYFYFNPGEAMLYSSQTLLPVLLVLVLRFEKTHFRYKYHAAVLFSFVLFVNNYSSLISFASMK